MSRSDTATELAEAFSTLPIEHQLPVLLDFLIVLAVNVLPRGQVEPTLDAIKRTCVLRSQEGEEWKQ